MSSKKIKLRLYADENFPLPTCMFLRSKGVSIVHAYDFGFTNKSDLFHIKKAKALKRTIITIDRDFLYYPGISSYDSLGAIVISTSNPTPFNINSICLKALVKITQHLVKSSYIKITTNKIHRIKDGETVVFKL